MAIRYSKKTNERIDKLVRNYNAKINRLARSGSDIALPRKLSREAVVALKNSVSNRADLNRRLADLSSFTARGGEKLISVKGTTLPKYQYETITRYKRLLSRRINAKIKFYTEERPKNKGVDEYSTYAQMGDKDYLNAVAKKNLLLNKKLEDLSGTDIDTYIDLLQRNAKTKSKELWKENYIDILVDTADTYGYDKVKTDQLVRRLNKLTPAQLDKLFTSERTIQQILYYYKPIKDLGIEVAVKDMQDDALVNFDNLYNNLDEILAEYE